MNAYETVELEFEKNLYNKLCRIADVQKTSMQEVIENTLRRGIERGKSA
jgi:hypothetical protein